MKYEPSYDTEDLPRILETAKGESFGTLTHSNMERPQAEEREGFSRIVGNVFHDILNSFCHRFDTQLRRLQRFWEFHSSCESLASEMFYQRRNISRRFHDTLTSSRSIKTCKLSFSCSWLLLHLPQGVDVFFRQRKETISNGFYGHVCHSLNSSDHPDKQLFHLNNKLLISSVPMGKLRRSPKSHLTIFYVIKNHFRIWHATRRRRGERFATFCSSLRWEICTFAGS